MSDKHDAALYDEFFKKPSYDVLPKPEGSWQEDYNRRNAKANQIFAVGLVVGGAVLAHSLYDPLPPVTRADLPIDPRADLV